MYRLFLAHFGKAARLQFVKEEVRAKLTFDSEGNVSLINRDLRAKDLEKEPSSRASRH